MEENNNVIDGNVSENVIQEQPAEQQSEEVKQPAEQQSEEVKQPEAAPQPEEVKQPESVQQPAPEPVKAEEKEHSKTAKALGSLLCVGILVLIILLLFKGCGNVKPLITLKPAMTVDGVVSSGKTIGSKSTAADDKESKALTDKKDDASDKKGSPVSSAAGKHEHNWVEKVETVHHDAGYEEVWVVDKQAWTETVTPAQTVEVCSCGWRSDMTQEEQNMYQFHYMAEWDGTKDMHTTHDETVPAETIEHPEEGHYEQQEVSAAYDEKIVTYVCSECGAVKED